MDIYEQHHEKNCFFCATMTQISQCICSLISETVQLVLLLMTLATIKSKTFGYLKTYCNKFKILSFYGLVVCLNDAEQMKQCRPDLEAD